MLWLTRTESDNQKAQQLFESAGYVCVAQPIFSLKPRALAPELRAQVLSLDNYNGVIFVSKMAAKQGLNAFDEYWPQFPAGQLWCAMGETTAAELEASGQTIIIADPPNSEGLIAQLSLDQLSGQKWLIVRGNGGRELLKKELEAKGATVDYLELYDRVSQLNDERIKQLINQSLSGIVVASTQAIGELASYARGDADLFELPIVVPGERAAKKAKAAGFANVITALSANNHELLNAWMQYKEDLHE